jgi:type II secretion system protein G
MLFRRGFTLIELLIVVAIIAILAAIAVPNFLEAQVRSKISRTMADMRTVGIALESYRVDWIEYPNLLSTEERLESGYVANWLIVVPGHENDGHYTGIQLTTPLAYITSVPFDAFMSAIAPGEPVYPGEGRRASFVASIQLITDADPITGTIMRNHHLLGVFHWLLESPGPDLRWWDGTHPETFLYDPTNGTVSQGQIALTDGGWVSPVK